MLRSRIAVLFAVALGCLVLPATARAQSAFAGVVKDATGAVLPGVTVEASSPALIEKVRSVTTDANGLYRIENLPGRGLHDRTGQECSLTEQIAVSLRQHPSYVWRRVF